MHLPPSDSGSSVRRRPRGAAILLLLLLAFVLFLLVTAALEAHDYLHRQNRQAQQALQDRASQLRVLPDPP